jgi:signal transduction histidine kinase
VEDARDAALRHAIDAARHAALYSLGHFDAADPLYDAMQARATNPLALLEPTCLQMRGLDMRWRMRDAMALGLRMLAQLGLAVPAGPADAGLEQRLDGLRDWVARESRLDAAARPRIQDARLLALAKLLGRTVRSALGCSDENAMLWLLLESQRLWVEHGPCAELVASLGRLGNLLISRRGDYRAAYEICRHVVTVGEALGDEPQTSEARFVYSVYACHWFEPLENVFAQVSRACEGVLSVGDVSYAGYVRVFVMTTFWDLAASLAAADGKVATGLALCERTGNRDAAIPHLLVRQMLRALRGQTAGDDSFDDAEFDEAEFLARAGGMPYIGGIHAVCRAMHAFAMGNAGTLARTTARDLSQLGNFAGHYTTAHLHFYRGVSRAWQLRDAADAAERQRLLDELHASLDWLAARAADQPYNFGHLHRLLQAERAWALGELWQAAAAFDAALVEAETRARPWHRAAILERAGLFHRAQGLAHASGRLLAQAHEAYAAWGASAKVAQLQRDHPFLLRAATPLPQAGVAATPARFSPGSNTVSSDALELMGVLRASQVLSSETSLQRLTVRVTQVLAGLTGATKVQLLAWADDEWLLLSPEAPQASIPARQAAEHGLLPLSAVTYAGRTGEPLLLDDAPHDDRFAGDPYFAGQRDGSLLLVPIARQGAGRFMLLLENRLTRAAFNAQRLDAVKLIAGQLAVSLANVQLYESLEQRVQARTRELQEMQARLVATARKAGRAEIASNVLHNVGNVLNSINVSASAVRRTISNSRMEGLARAVDLLNEHAGDLAQFLADDARGLALRRYLNELVAALQSEREDALADLDRLAGSVEHITYVVATQQSHTGPSSVLEAVAPREVLEEALRLSEDAVVRGGAFVVRDYGELPVASLDKQRLLQILVNLVSNAVQAMAGLPPAEREIVLAAHVVPGADGERLRISVRDCGEGIAPENLGRIFSHGFTTREQGHGFGLHSSSVAAMEMAGKLTAHSDGPGQGAVLTVEVPLHPAGGGQRG